ncbi:M48 family metalloprotease [Streptomyces phaeochromogenes]
MTTSFNAHDFLHPLDLAARQQLEKVPLLEAAAKKYRSLKADRQDRAMLLANAIRLGPKQIPETYKLLPPICATFGIPEPELYVMPGPPNAATFGHSQVAIVVYNEMLEALPEEEIQAVLAHECGHILAGHVLYRQMALAIVGAGEQAGALSGKIGMIAGLATEPLKASLLNWYRKSELTADRAAAVFMGGPETLQRALFHLIGVPKWYPGDISYEMFAAQADEFEAITTGNKWDRYLARGLEQGATHPNPVVRIRELQTWAESETFRQLMAISRAALPGPRSACDGCGHEVTADWRFCQRCGAPIALPAGGNVSGGAA